MYTVILVVHIIVALMLIGLILVQRSDSDGFGLGGGGNSLMTGRASANLLTRTTDILATIFILTSLGLNFFGERHKAASSLADRISATGETPLDNPAQTAPVTAPLSENQAAPRDSQPAPPISESTTKPVKGPSVPKPQE